jgi:CheY-like chemotaxis protein
VVAVDDGQRAIQTFAPNGAAMFDVVITDLGMPQVDGRQVAAAVKAASPATPVIMLTGWAWRKPTFHGTSTAC